jgi:hypothetical protein
MRTRKRNSTFGVALNRKTFQLEGGVFSCIKGLGELTQVVLRNYCPLLQP